jgi:hypothetical protein
MIVGKKAPNSASVIVRVNNRTVAMINKIRPSTEVRQLVNIRVFIWFVLIGLREIPGYRQSSL